MNWYYHMVGVSCSTDTQTEQLGFDHIQCLSILGPYGSTMQLPNHTPGWRTLIFLYLHWDYHPSDCCSFLPPKSSWNSVFWDLRMFFFPHRIWHWHQIEAALACLFLHIDAAVHTYLKLQRLNGMAWPYHSSVYESCQSNMAQPS